MKIWLLVLMIYVSMKMIQNFQSVENDGEEDLNVQDLPLDNIEELELRQQHLKHQTIDEEPVVGDEQVVGEEKIDDEEQVVGEEKVVG